MPRTPVVAAPPAPTAASEWPAAYAQASLEARQNRLGLADRALSEFATRFPGSPEAAEVPYWRAVYKLDPASGAPMSDALALLDHYLTNAPSGLHRVEAATLRRLATAADTRVPAAQPAATVPKPEDRALEEEVQRLRDELARANAELTRIRRRLARPQP